MGYVLASTLPERGMHQQRRHLAGPGGTSGVALPDGAVFTVPPAASCRLVRPVADPFPIGPGLKLSPSPAGCVVRRGSGLHRDGVGSRACFWFLLGSFVGQGPAGARAMRVQGRVGTADLPVPTIEFCLEPMPEPARLTRRRPAR
ncbi:hypothetical protein, partial [Paracraurococcus ruber]|uniref:hypothetical protein n=1 Tax=Paracraurococcus ruber TaxID=77675 RepID=UPI001907F099